MKSVLTLAAAAALVIVAWQGATAQQSADDVKWITACVKDNKDEDQAAPVILGYCTCMNDGGSAKIMGDIVR